jgi:hypothetical protein
MKNAPYPNPYPTIILARKCPLLPDQFFTFTSAFETTCESDRLRSVFHQNRYATQASSRYSAKPEIRIPNTNLILSSVKKDLDLAFVFTVFLPLFSFFISNQLFLKAGPVRAPKGNNFRKDQTEVNNL